MARLKVLAVSAGIAALMLIPQVGSAQVGSEDNLGYQAMRNHDWTLAEQQLKVGLQKNPDNVFRQLNLAWVYAQTGRKAEAAVIYQQILMSDGDRVASLPSREAMPVKRLAERGLALLQNP